MFSRIMFLAVAVAPVSLMLPGPVIAADEADEHVESQRCINTSTIRSTRVIDDSHIVFVMRGNKLFLNTLRRECRGLGREGRFSYVVRSHSLCRNDQISVLYASGFGLQEGRSCGLGMFTPITKEDLEELVNPPGVEPEPQPVEPPPVQDVVEEAGDGEPPAD